MRTDMLHQLEGVVRRAGDIVREAHDIERATMEKHGAADLVTKYDVAVQGFLQRELLALLPEADFLGEEGDHTTLTRPWTFIVDPIDGTTNFVRRLHYSDISVALAQDGQTQYAVVYDPFADELFSAQKDGGAFCNGLPIRVSERDMAHAVFLCGSTIYDRSLTEQNFSLIRQLYEKGLDFRRFGAAALFVRRGKDLGQHHGRQREEQRHDHQLRQQGVSALLRHAPTSARSDTHTEQSPPCASVISTTMRPSSMRGSNRPSAHSASPCSGLKGRSAAAYSSRSAPSYRYSRLTKRSPE